MRTLLFFSLCFLLYTPIFAQHTASTILGKSLHELRQPPTPSLFSSIHFLDQHTRHLLPPINTNASQALPHILSVSEHYYKHLGFFCKVELRLEQKARLPIKFRLGEVQYVERLEGKYD